MSAVGKCLFMVKIYYKITIYKFNLFIFSLELIS